MGRGMGEEGEARGGTAATYRYYSSYWPRVVAEAAPASVDVEIAFVRRARAFEAKIL